LIALIFVVDHGVHDSLVFEQVPFLQLDKLLSNFDVLGKWPRIGFHLLKNVRHFAEFQNVLELIKRDDDDL